MKIEQIKKSSLLTAIKTPYNNNGEIDFDTFDLLISRQIKAGVDGVIICGTTGEGHLLTWKEHLSLISHSTQNFSDKLLIVGNTGSNSTKESIRATKEAFNQGCHACLQINPYYGKTSSAGIIKHLELALEIGPCFIYNVPSRTAQDIKPKIIRQIAQHHNFVGVKECNGGNGRMKIYEQEGIACWTGNDDEIFASLHKDKAHGAISVTSNIMPAVFRSIIDSNDEKLFKKILPLINLLFIEPNPMPLNTILAMMGLCKPIIKLPYLPLTVAQQQQIKTTFEQVELNLEPLKIINPADFTLLS